MVHAVRDRAFFPGPLRNGDSAWFALPAVVVTLADVAGWPYSVGILVKWVTFLGTLHWPVRGADLGVGGVSFVELLILYELWAGERRVLEKATPRYQRLGRQISVSAVPFGPGIALLHVYWGSNEVVVCLAWWSWWVRALHDWCQSLQASAHWVGEVWSRSYFLAK